MSLSLIRWRQRKQASADDFNFTSSQPRYHLLTHQDLQKFFTQISLKIRTNKFKKTSKCWRLQLHLIPTQISPTADVTPHNLQKFHAQISFKVAKQILIRTNNQVLTTSTSPQVNLQMSHLTIFHTNSQISLKKAQASLTNIIEKTEANLNIIKKLRQTENQSLHQKSWRRSRNKYY